MNYLIYSLLILILYLSLDLRKVFNFRNMSLICIVCFTTQFQPVSNINMNVNIHKGEKAYLISVSNYMYIENNHILDDMTSGTSRYINKDCSKNYNNNFDNIYEKHDSHYLKYAKCLKGCDILNITNLFYVAKLRSRPPFRLASDAVCNPRPKSVSLILLLLLISGDTGSLVNPGPNSNCTMCLSDIRYADNFSMCIDCHSNFHDNCINYDNNIGNYICNICTNQMLPFSSLIDSSITEEVNIETVENDHYSNILNPSELSDDYFECFKRKGCILYI